MPLALGNRTLFVILGPLWYVKELGVSVKKGEKIQVIGSKVYGPQGRIYIIARKIIIPSQDKSYTFRDESYAPYWRSPNTPSHQNPRGSTMPPFPAFFGKGRRGGHHR